MFIEVLQIPVRAIHGVVVEVTGLFRVWGELAVGHCHGDSVDPHRWPLTMIGRLANIGQRSSSLVTPSKASFMIGLGAFLRWEISNEE